MDSLEKVSEGRVIDGRREDDAYTIIALSTDAKQAWKFTFGNSPAWAPVRFDFYLAKTGRFASTKEVWGQLKNRIHVYSTSTAWTEVAAGSWAPSSVRLYEYSLGRAYSETEIEVVFADWKFGKDVPDSRFASDTFTKDQLMKIDFDEIRKFVSEVSRARRRDTSSSDR